MNRYTVLFVDDEINIQRSIKRLLRKEDYEVITVSNGFEALEIIRSQKIHLVISDFRMPEMTGTQLLQKIKELDSSTIRVILSGYANAGVVVEAINKGEIYRFLTKPWDDEQLKIAVRQCLEQYQIIQENKSLLKKIEQQNEDLELTILERTRSLKLSKEILNSLPVGVIYVSPRGDLELINHEALKIFPSLTNLKPGGNITSFFPEPLSQIYDQFHSNNNQKLSKKLTINNCDGQVQIYSLYQNESANGFIIVIDVCKN